MEIRENNIHAVENYLSAAKELNSFIKNSFSKTERSQLCIASIIDDLHNENDKIEKAIIKYQKTNVSEYLHKDMYLKGEISNCQVYSKYVLIHIPEDISDNTKKVSITYFDLPFMNHLSDCQVFVNKKSIQINAMELIQHIVSGKLSECPPDEYNDANALFISVSAFADRFRQKHIQKA